MMNAYDEKYPEAKEYPNRYENWWFDGSWDFDFKAAVDHSQTQMKEVNTDGKCDIGKIQVTRTPFELNLSYDMNKAKGYFVTLLDAEGKPLENGHFGGSVDDLAIDGHDVSKVTVYVCDEAELTKEDIVSARASQSPFNEDLYEVSGKLTPDGRGRLARLTRDYKPHGAKNPSNNGRALAIVVNGELVAAPIIYAEIDMGEFVITGNFTREEAVNLAAALNAKGSEED